MPNSNNLPKAAIISSLTGGLGHYCAHLASPLSKYFSLKFIAYPQIDLTGTVVKQITDSFVKKHVKWPRFDLDESNPISIVQINDYLQSRGINLINIHVATTVKRKIQYFTTFFLYSKKFNHKKFIFTLHDVLPFDEDKKLIKLLKVFYSLADYFTVGNENEKGKLIKYFDIPDSKIVIIPHGIYNLFDANIYTQERARDYLGLPNDKKIILFFGFLREYKGFNYLIDAAHILEKKNNNFVIYVASGLKYTPKDLVERYLKTIEQLNLQDKFILNLNYLDTVDIEAVFKASDVVALPYTHASQSGVMMMAFGFKKPVVITDAFYDKNWIDKKAGLVAENKNPQSLAEKTYELITDDQKMKNFGEYGYQYAQKAFNWNIVAKKYAQIYQKLLNKI